MKLDYLLKRYIEKTGYGMDMWGKEENEVMTTIAQILEEDKTIMTEQCYIRRKVGCHCIDECEYNTDIKDGLAK